MLASKGKTLCRSQWAGIWLILDDDVADDGHCEVQIGMQFWHGVIEVTTITAAHETQSVKLELATRPRTATNLPLTLICWPYTSVVVGACVPLWTGLVTLFCWPLIQWPAGVWSHTPKGWLGVCVCSAPPPRTL